MRRLFPQYIYDGTDAPFHWLPNEVVVHIFSYLDVHAVVRVRATCCRWRGIVSADQTLWRILCRRYFPLVALERAPGANEDHVARFRRLYEGTESFPVQVMNPRRYVEDNTGSFGPGRGTTRARDSDGGAARRGRPRSARGCPLRCGNNRVVP